jgi:putative FmdB family regulatory protein
MPVYEFVCGSCDRKFEVLVRSSRARISCPECGSKKVRKILSVFALNTGASPGGGKSSCGSCSPKQPGGCGS